jgi:hypothetical protein
MKRYATALTHYANHIKRVVMALTLVFLATSVVLATLSWSEIAAAGTIKTHCKMHTAGTPGAHDKASRQHRSAASKRPHDCCPKRHNAPSGTSDCCKHPCHAQAVTTIAPLSGSAEVTMALFQAQMAHSRYRESVAARMCRPELRPPII